MTLGVFIFSSRLIGRRHFAYCPQIVVAMCTPVSDFKDVVDVSRCDLFGHRSTLHRR